MGIFFLEESGQKLHGVCTQSPCECRAVTFCTRALPSAVRVAQGAHTKAAHVLLLRVGTQLHRNPVGTMSFTSAHFSKTHRWHSCLNRDVTQAHGSGTAAQRYPCVLPWFLFPFLLFSRVCVRRARRVCGELGGLRSAGGWQDGSDCLIRGSSGGSLLLIHALANAWPSAFYSLFVKKTAAFGCCHCLNRVTCRVLPLLPAPTMLHQWGGTEEGWGGTRGWLMAASSPAGQRPAQSLPSALPQGDRGSHHLPGPSVSPQLPDGFHCWA